MFCSKCGTELEAGQEFCPKCGNPKGINVVVKKQKTGKGFAVTSFIFGIMTLLNSRMAVGLNIEISRNSAFFVCFSLTMIFGLISFIKYKRKLALAGMIIAVLSLIFAIIV